MGREKSQSRDYIPSAKQRTHCFRFHLRDPAARAPNTACTGCYGGIRIRASIWRSPLRLDSSYVRTRDVCVHGRSSAHRDRSRVRVCTRARGNNTRWSGVRSGASGGEGGSKRSSPNRMGKKSMSGPCVRVFWKSVLWVGLIY